MLRVFEASSPRVEVDGRTVLAVVNGMLVGSVAQELLEAQGLSGVKPEAWYPQQAWLNVYRAINDELGPDTLYSIGRRIPQSAEFPEQMYDVPTALSAIDVAYHKAHRNGEIGEYRYLELGLDHYQIHCDNPYPNIFDLGIVTSLVERFRGRLQFRITMLQRGAGRLWDNACAFDISRA
ncbi:MAG: hypothetical protein IT463_08040 [Planctomycetes bacterium]|nr:hypothetical protein [Planctomycetota bacterium]